MTEGILFICAHVVSFAARARSARAANDTTREQVNNIPEKSQIIIIINIQGQITSRYKLSHLMSFTCSIIQVLP